MVSFKSLFTTLFFSFAFTFCFPKVSKIASQKEINLQKLEKAVKNFQLKTSEGSDIDFENLQEDLNLLEKGLNGTEISWSCSHEGTTKAWEKTNPCAVDPETGKIRRPFYGVGDQLVTLVATFSLGGEKKQRVFEAIKVAQESSGKLSDVSLEIPEIFSQPVSVASYPYIIETSHFPGKRPATQSWLYCPLINEALSRLGVESEKHINSDSLFGVDSPSASDWAQRMPHIFNLMVNLMLENLKKEDSPEWTDADHLSVGGEVYYFDGSQHMDGNDQEKFFSKYTSLNFKGSPLSGAFYDLIEDEELRNFVKQENFALFDEEIKIMLGERESLFNLFLNPIVDLLPR